MTKTINENSSIFQQIWRQIERHKRFLFAVYLLGLFTAHVINTGDEVDLNNFFLGIRVDHWVHGSLFLPLGILAPLVIENRPKLVLTMIFCSLFFETLQYFLPYRSFDWTDIRADVCGTLIGLLFYWMLKKWLISDFKKE